MTIEQENRLRCFNFALDYRSTTERLLLINENPHERKNELPRLRTQAGSHYRPDIGDSHEEPEMKEAWEKLSGILEQLISQGDPALA